MKKGVVKEKMMGVVAVLMLGATLCSCTVNREYTPQMTLSSTMPNTAKAGGENLLSLEAQLYFVSEDGMRLSVESRTIEYDGNTSRVEAVINALIAGPDSAVYQESIPGDMTLQKAELSTDVCNVYLLASYIPDVDVWLTARAALAATVYQCEGIESINLYLNGMEPGYYGRALGAMMPISGKLDTYITNLKQEYEALEIQEATEASVYESRTATLYFTNSESKYLIAANEEINYDCGLTTGQIAQLLISKLQDGDEGLEPVLPVNLTLAAVPQVIPVGIIDAMYNSEDGDIPHPEASPNWRKEQEWSKPDEEGVVELLINEPASTYGENIMCGALTLTLTGYLPNISGVAIAMKKADGTIVNLSEKGYFTRDDYAVYIGRNIYLAFPDSEGSMLHRVSRVISSGSAYDPQTRLRELLQGEADPGVRYPLFEGDDVLDVYITGDTAVVNWKAGFAQKLRDLIATDQTSLPQDRRERLFVYSVVNTLTEIPGVQRVWMLEDGKKLGMIDQIYLGNALLRNPGIMIDE